MPPGSRRDRIAAGYSSVSENEFSNAAEPTPDPNITQAAAPIKTAGATRYDTACRALPGSREGRIIDWLRGVSRDSRIGVLHRFALIGIGLHHRRDEPDAVASAIGLDRATVLRAVDVGGRYGWLAHLPGRAPRFAFTFPQGQGVDERGKIKYAHCFDFDSREIRDAFSRAVIDEVLRAFPDALGVEQEDALP
jgi:hypothetical protein